MAIITSLLNTPAKTPVATQPSSPAIGSRCLQDTQQVQEQSKGPRWYPHPLSLFHVLTVTVKCFVRKLLWLLSLHKSNQSAQSTIHVHQGDTFLCIFLIVLHNCCQILCRDCAAGPIMEPFPPSSTYSKTINFKDI